MKLTHAPIVVRNQDEALNFYTDCSGSRSARTTSCRVIRAG